jgi:hypothetical protein
MRSRLTTGLLSVLLLAALTAMTVFYVKASRPLYHDRDEQLVDRATRAAATHLRMTGEQIKRGTFPIAMRLSEQTCVELRPKRDDLGGYLACYRGDSGKLIEERVMSAPFGQRRFFPPLW